LQLLIYASSAYFDLPAKIKIAKALDDFGVDCKMPLDLEFCLNTETDAPERH
jgi:hypothetical protein